MEGGRGRPSTSSNVHAARRRVAGGGAANAGDARVDRRQMAARPGATMDLVLLAAVAVTALVATIAAIWVVPLVVVAALASAADDLA